VPRTIVTSKDASSIPELYAHAGELARRGEHLEAAREFERVFALDPDGALADDALFQAASEQDEASLFAASAASYQKLARRFPKSELRTAALVRTTRLLAYLESFREAGDIAEHLLAAKPELGPFEYVVLYGASALARLGQDDEQAAQAFIEKGRAVIDAHQLDAAGRVSRDLSALYFALGELRRRRAERIVFQPTPADFAAALEQRCQLLLDAESAYSDAMRAYDAHWSAMAGFRVGELYERLHRDLMQVTPPPSADTLAKRQLFEGAMRLRYAILLEKALKMIEHTLSMSERTGERSAWVEKSREAHADIERAMKREQAALSTLPYSRATLEQALLDLQRRHATAAGQSRSK
jgi:tetratricopeptide (TPR) repeat protein